jgi:hypothetical protein
MGTLAAGHFDGMAHLHDIEPVRVQRVSREGLKGRGRRGRAMHQPAGAAAGNEGEQRGGDGAIDPFARRLHQPVELKALRHRLVGNRVITGVQRLGHRAPGMHALGIVRVRSKPHLDIAAALGRQLVVDVGVQLVFGYGNFRIGHCGRLCPIPVGKYLCISHATIGYFTRRNAGRSPWSEAFTCARARASRDITVPIGTPWMSATSR